MARNIEIKARARSFDELRKRAAALSSNAPLIFRQHDCFYEVPRGRLKLRQFDDGTPGELIFYQRDDREGPKTSYYTRCPVTNAEALHALLATALTTRGVVSKERHVYLAGRTRIHLDRVDGLGDFVELEVVLSAEDDEESGTARAHAVDTGHPHQLFHDERGQSVQIGEVVELQDHRIPHGMEHLRLIAA